MIGLRGRKPRRSGVELVELAMTLPIIMMICLGILEMSRAFQVSQILTAAAREGARLGMLYNIKLATGQANANDKVKQDIKNFLVASGITATPTIYIVKAEPAPTTTSVSAPTVSLDDYDSINNEHFRVRVEVNFNDVSLGPPNFLKGTKLHGEIVMKHE